MVNRPSKTIQVLLATGIYPPDIGGPATYAKLMFDQLPKRGLDVRVISFGGVRRYPVGLRHLAYFLKVFIAARNTDVIFTQDTVSTGLPAVLAAKLLRKKFIVRVPGDYAWEQGAQRFGVRESIDEFQTKKYSWRIEILRYIQKWVVNHADAVITPSFYFKKMVDGWCSGLDKAIPIYNGIILGERKWDKLSARSRLGLGSNKLIVTSGRLVPWKGFDVLIKVVKRARACGRLWDLIIIGEGPWRQELEQIIKLGDLEGSVKLTGSISREELFCYLNAADVFVLNTSFESFSFQTVEAMNQGIPVVTTNIGNLAEIVEDGKEGILVKPNDSDALMAAIIKMLDDRDFAKTVVSNANVKAQKFSVDRTLDRLAETIQQVV